MSLVVGLPPEAPDWLGGFERIGSASSALSALADFLVHLTSFAGSVGASWGPLCELAATYAAQVGAEQAPTRARAAQIIIMVLQWPPPLELGGRVGRATFIRA